MDTPRFDALARGAARVHRRALAALLGAAAGLVAGVAPALDDAPGASAKRRVRGEHNVRGNKAIMCIDGATRKVPKKKRKAYLAQGATRGACASATCPAGQKACNGGCIASTACCTNADCTSPATCQNGACVAPLRCGEGGPCRVFVSAETSLGALGGPSGADGLCSLMATAASLTGTYMAWVGAGIDVPATRFTNTNLGGPYHLVANNTDSGGEGPVVANDFAELTSCSSGGDCLQHSIDRDQTGTTLGTAADVWTGVEATGLSATLTCNGWTDNSGSSYGVYGGTNFVDSFWTSADNAACDGARRIFCIEQPAVV
ncbi:MAG: hypothetical protein QM692_14100 [Thermomicrobiales bacterium]